MRTIYIGSGPKKKEGGLKWKVYLFLFLFVLIFGSALKVTAPTIVEKWINHQGANSAGYAFSIRDVNLALEKGQITLNDVKIFNPDTNTELVEAPQLIVSVNLTDLILYQEKKVSIVADKVDVTLSKDFSSELDRITTSAQNNKYDHYLEAIDAKFGKLNLIEKKDNLSRTMLELNDVNLNVKDISLLSVNQKTEFNISSNVADGGKFNLNGKTGEGKWALKGSLKQIPSGMFNKLAGNKLPFSFNESSLNAEISAQSEQGKIVGEITPDIKRLNLIDEKPGVPTQIIARALNDELSFTLPFTLKDELKLQYADTYKKLKEYRKSPVTLASSDPSRSPSEEGAAATAVPAPKAEKTKKSFSFWTF